MFETKRAQGRYLHMPLPRVDASSPPPQRRDLPHDEVSQDQREAIDTAIASARARPTGSAPTNVKVVVQVVTAKSETAAPVANSALERQLAVLNTTYKTSGFTFSLERVVRTKVDSLPTKDKELAALKEELRQGDQSTLNLFVLPDLKLDGVALLGIATFPWDVSKHPAADGVTITAKSLPGATTDSYSNGGKTATHEIGHWLGLWHTFQGGCKGSGDRIGDTPAQAAAPKKPMPPENTDTCPAKPGNDPVHNYMNYVSDLWASEFTPGQTETMHKAWAKFRE